MFGIGGFELFLILLFAFLIFGPDKLPQLAKTLGMAIRKFRDAQDEVNRVVKTEIYDPLSENPVKDPLAAIDKENRQKAEKKESFAAAKPNTIKNARPGSSARPPMPPPLKSAPPCVRKPPNDATNPRVLPSPLPKCMSASWGPAGKQPNRPKPKAAPLGLRIASLPTRSSA